MYAPSESSTDSELHDEITFPSYKLSVGPWSEQNPAIPSNTIQRQEHCLCNMCQDLFARSELIKTFPTVNKASESICYVDLKDTVAQRARRGCHICCLNLASRKAFNLQKYYQDDCNFNDEGQELRSDDLDVMLFVDKPLKDESRHVRMILNGELRITNQRLANNTDEMIPKGSTTESEDSVALVEFWLSQCIKNHGPCNASLGIEQDVPSRLLHLHRNAGRVIIRLVKKAELRSFPDYCILSYCWGDKVFLKLESSSLVAFCKGIDWCDLPKTFQDAAKLTLKLGFSYLWIDSLCILQDSIADWEKEGIKMSSYFGNAVCNISALGAVDSAEGLHSLRDPLLSRPCRVQRPDGMELWVSSDRNPLRDFHHFNLPLHDGSGKKTPYSYRFQERGWVFQERVLSRRSVYFSDTGIYWECRKGYASERDPYLETEGRERSTILTPPLKNLKKAFYSIIQLKEPLWGLTTPTRWASLLRIYSGLLLTFEKDKLVALSGIIKALEKDFNSRSIAGLWEHCLVRDLLWYVGKPKPREEPLKVYLTNTRRSLALPTWSWASLRGSIELQSQFGSLNSEVDVVVLGEDEENKFPFYNKPLQLRIRLREPLCCLQVSTPNNRPDYYYCLRPNGKFCGVLEFYPDVHFQEVELDNEEVWALRLCDLPTDGWYEGRAGLIVIPINSEKTMWARLGIWMIRDDESTATSVVVPDPNLAHLESVILI